MISIKQWESHGPHPRKVCDNFSLKGWVSHKHLKGGNLDLIFQLMITLGMIKEEKILLLYGTVWRSKTKQVFTCVFSDVVCHK